MELLLAVLGMLVAAEKATQMARIGPIMLIIVVPVMVVGVILLLKKSKTGSGRAPGGI